MFHDSPALIKAASRAHQVTWDRRRALRAMFQLDGLLSVVRTPLCRPGYGLSSLRYGHCVTENTSSPKTTDAEQPRLENRHLANLRTRRSATTASMLQEVGSECQGPVKAVAKIGVTLKSNSETHTSGVLVSNRVPIFCQCRQLLQNIRVGTCRDDPG
ncbi:MAG: hypothetical protein JWM11_2545 [Planctomycetaceae bacterium]|nr:hypothetical protein [Planctomycetaceae bacterium]